MTWFVVSRKQQPNGSDEDTIMEVEGDDRAIGECDLEAGGRTAPFFCDSAPSSLAPASSSNNTSPSSSLSEVPFDHDEDDPRQKVVSFRALQKNDRERIQHLHEQWFPVLYSDEFYDQLCTNHRLATSGDELFTCVATLQDENGFYCQAATADGSGSEAMPNPLYNLQQQQQQQVEDDEIIGCCVGTMVHHSRLNPETAELLVPNSQVHPKLFYIMTLGTVEEYRKLGVATSLVQKCIEIVQKDTSCGALYLHVIPFNYAAIRFYEKLGFWRVCTIPDYYNIDNKNYDCYLYAKYFHGNRGHLTLYQIVSGAISSLWRHIKGPLSMFVDLHSE